MLPVRYPSKSSSISEGSNSSKPISKRTTFKSKNIIKKRNDMGVIYNNEDVTPKILPPLDYSGNTGELLSLSQIETRSNYEISVFGNLSASVLVTNMHTQSVIANSRTSYVSIMNKDDFIDDSYSTEQPSEGTIIEEENYYEEPYTMPKDINIILTETPVLYLLEITSTTEVKGTEEGNEVEKDNAIYDYLTIGKGRNRKTTNAEIQTSMNLQKTRSTNLTRPTHNNDYAFASKWDMHDTYEDLGENTEDKIINITPAKEEIKYEMEIEFNDVEKQMEDLLDNPRFQRSVLVMERVLDNNIFNEQQKRFRGLTIQDPFRPDIEFKYKIDLLWTFKNNYVEGHSITAMEWHPENPDILVVGYGKFYYTDVKLGFMYCWNVKNPTQPEREYHFNSPVTAVSISKYEPNLVAVGLYDGTVSILDICSKRVHQLMVTKRDANSSYEPIWQIEWFAPDGFNMNDNHILTVCEDGIVRCFLAIKTNDLQQTEMMKVFRTESKLKGVYRPKECAANEIPISKTCSALTLTKHPHDEGMYFVGTSEGSVHKCSENYQNQHIDIVSCHTGPVYGIQFSHFCGRLYLTCGADSCIHIWLEDVKEPLVTLSNTFKPIEGAEWCPCNSTIIANISGDEIFLWDLQRKTYLPASVHKNPSNCRNTIIRFAPSGKNLVVGDIEGNVHVYSLVDVPFPPFYQASMLEQVMLKSLITRPDLQLIIRQEGVCYTGKQLNIY